MLCLHSFYRLFNIFFFKVTLLLLCLLLCVSCYMSYPCPVMCHLVLVFAAVVILPYLHTSIDVICLFLIAASEQCYDFCMLFFNDKYPEQSRVHSAFLLLYILYCIVIYLSCFAVLVSVAQWLCFRICRKPSGVPQRYHLIPLFFVILLMVLSVALRTPSVFCMGMILRYILSIKKLLTLKRY